ARGEQLQGDEYIERTKVFRDFAGRHVERSVQPFVDDADRSGDRLPLGGDVAACHGVVSLHDELVRAIEEHVDELVRAGARDGGLGAELAIGMGGIPEWSEHLLPVRVVSGCLLYRPARWRLEPDPGRADDEATCGPMRYSVGMLTTAASEPLSCARLASRALYWRISRASTRVRRFWRRSSRPSKISRRAFRDSVAPVIAPSIPSMSSRRPRTCLPIPNTPAWVSFAANRSWTCFGSASATESLSSEILSEPSRWTSMPALESRPTSMPSTVEPMMARSFDCIMLTVWLPCRAPAVRVAGS